MNIKNALEWVIRWLPTLGGLVAIIEIDPRTVVGAEKKAWVIEQFKIIAGELLPANLVPIGVALAPLAVDALVALANATGFFKSSAGPSVAPSPEG